MVYFTKLKDEFKVCFFFFLPSPWISLMGREWETKQRLCSWSKVMKVGVDLNKVLYKGSRANHHRLGRERARCFLRKDTLFTLLRVPTTNFIIHQLAQSSFGLQQKKKISLFFSPRCYFSQCRILTCPSKQAHSSGMTGLMLMFLTSAIMFKARHSYRDKHTVGNWWFTTLLQSTLEYFLV